MAECRPLKMLAARSIIRSASKSVPLDDAVLQAARVKGLTDELSADPEEGAAEKRSDTSLESETIDWHNLPVILDSPLVSRFAQIYRELESFGDIEALTSVREGRKPLSFANLLTGESRKLTWPWSGAWPIPWSKPLLLPQVACVLVDASSTT